MKLTKILFASTLLTSLTLFHPSNILAQTDYEPFRQDLITFVETYGNADSEVMLAILDMSSEELEEYYSMMSDPSLFAQVNEQAEARQAFQQELKSQLLLEPLLLAPSSGFPPDYPSGGNYDAYTATLPGFGIMLAGPTNRTDASAVGGAWIAFDALDFLALAAQAVCDAAILGGELIFCPLAGIANAAARADQVVLQQAAYQDGLIDGAEIEAAYENTVTIIGQGNDLSADLTAHDANIDGDLAAHDANIDGDLAAHDANIDGDLAAHDANIDGDLMAHDINIDGDLQQHDTDIKDLMGTVQETLDEKLELRTVHMQVLVIAQRERYLVSTTEGGLPVSVAFTAAEYFNESAPGFSPLASVSINEIEPGLYDVRLNLPPRAAANIFRLRVTHDEKFDHFGEVLFHWESVDIAH